MGLILMLQRMSGKRSRMSVAEGRSFLGKFGINADSLGLTGLGPGEFAREDSADLYLWFEGLKATVSREKKDNSRPEVRVTGDYATQVKNTGRNGLGIGTPGRVCYERIDKTVPLRS